MKLEQYIIYFWLCCLHIQVALNFTSSHGEEVSPAGFLGVLTLSSILTSSSILAPVVY